MELPTKHAFYLSVFFVVLLSGCGGGGGGSVSAPATAAEPTLSLAQTKLFRFSWNDVDGATTYRLLEDPDGVSGFSQVGNDIDAGVQQYDHTVPLYARLNARYILQSCNAGGCTDSNTVSVSGTLGEAIGYFKAGNTGVSDQFGFAVALSDDGGTLAVGAPYEDSSNPGIDAAPNDNGAADDSGAVYVFTRDENGWSQQAYIKADNPRAGDSFGWSLALDAEGNTLAVGAIYEDSATSGINTAPVYDNTANDSGAVFVFVRDNNAWSQQAYIKAGSTGASDEFGFALSLSDNGDTLAVGAYREDSNTTGVNSVPNDDGNADDSGAVYVFTRSNGTWAQQAYIKASNTDSNDWFGIYLSLSGNGDTLAVGAALEDSPSQQINVPSADNSGYDEYGAVYVFVRNNLSWAPQAYIKGSNLRPGDWFGRSLSLNKDGSTLAAGAYRDDSNTTGVNSSPNIDGNADNAGAAYVFTRANGNWSQQAYIKASNTGPDAQFGRSLSLDDPGNRLAVGAYLEDSSTSGLNNNADTAANWAGAAYVFIRNDALWSQQAYIKAGNTDAGDLFGTSVSLSGDGKTLAVGSPQEDGDSTGIGSTPNENAANAGAVYLY